MVRIEIDSPGCQIQFSGSALQVAAELTTAVNSIFNALRQKDPAGAEVFKSFLQRLLSDNSPAWTQKRDMTIVSIPRIKKGDAPTDQS